MARYRHIRGLGALFDPNKPMTTPFASGDTSAVIANFLGTDKGDLRTVYGGCPKDVKDEVEAANKCQYSSSRDEIRTKSGSLVAARDPNKPVVLIYPGRLNADKIERGLANAVLRATKAGVQVEDRAVLSTKNRRIGAAVLSTGSGGRVMVQGELAVPLDAETIRRAMQISTTGAGLEDYGAIDPQFIEDIAKGRSGESKKRKKGKKRSR